MDRKAMTPDMRHELAGDAIRATPLAAFLVSILGGVDWPAVAALLAAVYTLLLIIEKLWKWIFRPKLEAKRHEREDG